MDIHDEESQDVDLIILADTEKSVEEVGEKAGDLPHFQFMDGKGRLQNSTDSPREGFIALKITYMHVFKKQQEHARALLQKNQQLVAEILQLKKQSDLSLSQEQVRRSPCDTEVQTDLTDSYSDKENSDLHSQLALLEEKKSKLRSGLVHVAQFLLKREPLSSHLKKILDNLQGLDWDSEESVKELDYLVKVMSGLDDELSQLPTKDEASGNVQPPDKISTSAKHSFVQKRVTSHQIQSQCDQTRPETSKDFKSNTQQKQDAHRHGKDVGMDSEVLQEEDMYGAEGNGRDLDLVPYNLKRLHLKLRKLQSFPVEYRTMMKNFNDSLEQQKTTSSFKGDTFSYQRKTCTELREEPNVSSDISSFIHFQDIKMPPSDFPQSLRNSGHLQDGPILQEEFSNTSPVKVDSSGDTIPFELVRGPPSTVQFSPGVNKLAEWQSRSTGFAVASDYNPPPLVNSNMLEKGNKEHCAFIPGTSETNHQIPNQLHRSNKKEVIANSASKPISCDKGDRSNTRTVVMESSSHGLYIPGSHNDELATAHDNMQDMSENKDTTCKMECPVCHKNFSSGTTEAEVNSHVNLHFDERTLTDQGYDILNSC